MRRPPGAPLCRALLLTGTALVLALATTATSTSAVVSSGAKTVPVPRGAGAFDTSNPDHVIGRGDGASNSDVFGDSTKTGDRDVAIDRAGRGACG